MWLPIKTCQYRPVALSLHWLLVFLHAMCVVPMWAAQISRACLELVNDEWGEEHSLTATDIGELELTLSQHNTWDDFAACHEPTPGETSETFRFKTTPLSLYTLVRELAQWAVAERD